MTDIISARILYDYRRFWFAILSNGMSDHTAYQRCSNQCTRPAKRVNKKRGCLERGRNIPFQNLDPIRERISIQYGIENLNNNTLNSLLIKY